MLFSKSPPVINVQIRKFGGIKLLRKCIAIHNFATISFHHTLLHTTKTLLLVSNSTLNVDERHPSKQDRIIAHCKSQMGFLSMIYENQFHIESHYRDGANWLSYIVLHGVDRAVYFSW